MLRVMILSLLVVLLLPAVAPSAHAAGRDGVAVHTELTPDTHANAPLQPGAALENEENEEDLEAGRDLPVSAGVARPPVFRARRHARPAAAIRTPCFLRPTFGRAPPVVV